MCDTNVVRSHDVNVYLKFVYYIDHINQDKSLFLNISNPSLAALRGSSKVRTTQLRNISGIIRRVSHSPIL